MDNLAFEMQEDGARNASSVGKISPFSNSEKKRQWSLVSIFLLCLLACFITTAVGVLTLSLVYLNSKPHLERETSPPHTMVSQVQKAVDPKFQFLNHLPKSKVFEFPGGAIQWARYRNNIEDYLSDEEEAFGTSLNSLRSQMTLGTLRIKSKGLRAPHWHFNANEHGYLVQGTAWIGVVDDGGEVATTYNVTAGQVIFFPKNTLHWIKNMGHDDCFFLLFFSTHDELQTLDVDDVFFSTPEDIASRSLKPEGGVNFIRNFQKQTEDQGISLPPNLAELVLNATYAQSPDSLVWRYFFDLKGSREYKFPGGVIQRAQYWKNGNELSNNEKIFSEFLHQHQNALALNTLRIYNNGLRQPHFHFNANEMGYVVSGCGKETERLKRFYIYEVEVGITDTQRTIEFNIHVGDVVFFPIGTQHYIKNTCDEDLLFVLAFSTGDQVQTLDMDDYLQATSDHILAQLFFRKQSEFKKIPRFTEDQAINLP
ncbi:Predicted gene, 36255 [Apodemus speciosus]|uniref:Predicted gene, 36255 n=1 Tax=Apodemus speciosus TaxID=105296 RepID=A0ABQ0FRI3_APOSI